jgi:hypothetical protein
MIFYHLSRIKAKGVFFFPLSLLLVKAITEDTSSKAKTKTQTSSVFFSQNNLSLANSSAATKDTSVLEMYTLFNKAIKESLMTGDHSAEYYFAQLDKKFHGNTYVIDATSVITAEYVNAAQRCINKYLNDCIDNTITTIEKEESFKAGAGLEKAIELIRGSDPEFAASLAPRMYFLKSGGDFGDKGKNGNISDGLRYGYAALSLNPTSAYIHNRLARLHYDNNCSDSASYYAKTAIRLAPKWGCPYETLQLTQGEKEQQYIVKSK